MLFQMKSQSIIDNFEYFSISFNKNNDKLDTNLIVLKHSLNSDTIGYSSNGNPIGNWFYFDSGHYSGYYPYHFHNLMKNIIEKTDSNFFNTKIHSANEFILNQGDFGFSIIYYPDFVEHSVFCRMIDSLIYGPVLIIFGSNYCEFNIVNNKIHGNMNFYNNKLQRIAIYKYDQGYLSGVSQIYFDKDTLSFEYLNGKLISCKKRINRHNSQFDILLPFKIKMIDEKPINRMNISSKLHRLPIFQTVLSCRYGMK